MAHDFVSGWIVTALLAGSVGLLAFVLCSRVLFSRRVRDRYGISPVAELSQEGSASARRAAPFGVDAAKLGLDEASQRKLRMSLIRAGHFSPHAPVIFTIVRSVLSVTIPLAAYFLIFWRLSDWGGLSKFLMMGMAVLVAYYLGAAYLDHRRRRLESEYRLFFPDFLDMLVVCVDAGLSLDAAIDRVVHEVGTNQVAFRTNLRLMMAEARAGKAMIDALRDFSQRLGLTEASSLVTLLQQSLELGTDISASLATFSEEMRDKRMSRAEERALALPVKMTIPLAFFILPTVFIVIMTPVAIKIITVLMRFAPAVR